MTEKRPCSVVPTLLRLHLHLFLAVTSSDKCQVNQNSLTTSAADLSTRRPWKTGWRTLPSSVISEYLTLHTSTGSTQVMSGVSLIGTSSGDVLRFKGTSFLYISPSVLVENPVPTLPMETSFPLS